MLGEDVEDQRSAVDHLDLDDVLELPQLTGRQLTVADHRVGTCCDNNVAQLLGLAGADEGRSIGRVTALNQSFQDLRPGGLRQRLQLLQRGLRLLERPGRPDADQDDPLEAQLAIFDLTDVLELGRYASDAA